MTAAPTSRTDEPAVKPQARDEALPRRSAIAAGLIEAACGGDRDAQGQLLEQLQDGWFRFAFCQLGDEHLARDATQEAALRVLQNLPRFRGESKLETWTLGIVLNVCREIRRGRRNLPDAFIQREVGDGQEDTDAPDVHAERKEQQERLHAMLGQLTDRQREALLLRHFEQWSTQEIARAMQCATGTVKATVSQAIAKLRSAWDEPS